MRVKYINKLPQHDINASAYLEYKGIQAELTLQGTRVVFEFPATNEVYALLREYQGNPSTPILDYVNVLRRLRARMLELRDNGKGNAYGNKSH